jgi:signal transduction histidine kinase
MKSPISQSATIPAMKTVARLPLMKWGGVLSLLVFQILLFLLFQERYGLVILSFGILPVIAAGWLFGFGGGIFSALALIAIDILLLRAIGQAGDLSQFLPAILVLFVLGIFSGGARNIFKQRLDQGQELKKRLQESEAISEIAIALSETERIGLSNILQLIVDSAKELIPGAEQAVIHLLDKDKEYLVPEAIAGFRHFEDRRGKMKLGEGVAGQVIETGKSIFISDVDTDARFVKLSDESQMRSLVVAPVFSGQQRLGTISVQSSQPNTFTLDESKLLHTLGTQAAIAIENAHLIENTRQALKETNALYRINQGLVASLDPDEVLNDTVELLQNNFGYYYVQIFVADPQTGNLVMLAGSGEVGKKLREMGHSLHPGEGLIGYVAETGTPFFTNNVHEVVSYIPNMLIPETQSELSVPVKIGNEILGVLDIQQIPPIQLTQRDIQLVSAVADQLAVALQKAKLHENLQNSLEQEKAIRGQLLQNERLAVMGRLLATVSHELNNPLQAIQNALFLLKEEKGISEQGRQDLNIVLAESEHMAAMIERLRDTYRPTRIQDFQPTQINKTIEDVHALISTHLRHNHVDLEFHPDPALPLIPALADQLRQVVLNLLMNAVEAMANGGKLMVCTRLLKDTDEILITITDTGNGIDPSILPNIFDAFVTNKKSGTGLGLTITYDIIMRHQGRIKAENNDGHGTTFSIWLPAANKEIA